MTKTSESNEWLIARCKTKDTHDFPELLDDKSGRCGNCKLWEEVDVHTKAVLEGLLEKANMYSNVTHDFGTAMVVSETMAVPVSAIKAAIKELE